MPIPFSDLTSNDSSATAGYLKFLPLAAKNTWLGALFVMNIRGEPVEFTHARVCPPNRLLWRADILRLRCQASLSTALFKACPVAPDIILCQAEVTSPELFTEYLQLKTPVVQALLCEQSKKAAARWVSDPGPGSPALSILERITKRNLLLEPFERAETGLREVYEELILR